MNSSDFIPHYVHRRFRDGIPEYDFVIILYRALTPTGRVSKYYHLFTYRYPHESHPNKVDRINECIHKTIGKKKPILRKGYKWDKFKVMRVD